ncbi:hypothetical protein AALO_G00235680 [Alosa alosa]|uniref:Uncharacterized protein n=1 Tax=Alosa alosa TaxID=278164 RepID=A0AAV6FZP5_9TELE|nr:hypothetical protein AALO_G00235680 [Alosa alosa]
MLYILGTVIGIICIIVCISKGLKEKDSKQGNGCQPPPQKQVANKKKNLTEQDLLLLARILTIGLVDADPTTLQHLREYRDLRGSTT